MIFYPFDFTYVCPTELIAFSDAIAQFKELDVNVLGVSNDSHFTHLAWIKTDRKKGGLGDMNFPLVADISKDLSRDFGVLVDNKDDELYGAALRGLYIIDGTGKLRAVQINDAPVGRSVDEVIRLIKAFKFTDIHGEVCPANWQPGDATIVPDQKEKMKFFEKNYLQTGKEDAPKANENAFKVEITQQGKGDKPKKGNQVTVHYTGKLLDGTVFDSSVTRKQPFVFQLGVGQVIKCWDEGIAQLNPTSKAVLTCPPEMAYGAGGAGGVIPPNATLKFEVELISFK